MVLTANVQIRRFVDGGTRPVGYYNQTLTNDVTQETISRNTVYEQSRSFVRIASHTH